MTPEDLGRIAGVLHGLGLSGDEADTDRRRQVLRRIMPVTGTLAQGVPPARDPLARALAADAAVIGRHLTSFAVELLDDGDRYRWEATRRAALARRYREERQILAGRPAGRRLAPLVLADARAIVRFEGRLFVAEALARILGRPPDMDAMRHYTDLLHRGVPKSRILREIAASPEGRWKRVYVRGLWQHTRIFRRRILAPPAVVWTARLLSRGRYDLG